MVARGYFFFKTVVSKTLYKFQMNIGPWKTLPLWISLWALPSESIQADWDKECERSSNFNSENLEIQDQYTYHLATCVRKNVSGENRNKLIRVRLEQELHGEKCYGYTGLNLDYISAHIEKDACNILINFCLQHVAGTRRQQNAVVICIFVSGLTRQKED